MHTNERNSKDVFHLASIGLFTAALIGVLHFQILTALIAGCAAYAMAHALRSTRLLQQCGPKATLVASICVAAIPVGFIVMAGVGASHYSHHASVSYQGMMGELTRALAEWRAMLPDSISTHIPSGEEQLKPWLESLVKSHASKLATFGKGSAHGLLMVIVGVVIGLLIANTGVPRAGHRPLSAAIKSRSSRLQFVFGAIVAAQFWIAMVNTVLTAFFFYAILPIAGKTMPYAELLLAMTFVCGMLPVVGNLICNTAITLVALTVGPSVAIASLVFLVIVHKLEYLINAKVVGTKMSMTAWELLIAMFAMEAIFGIPGLVAAPLFYAYLKSELMDLGWA